MPQQYVIVLDMGTSSLRAQAVPVDCPWAVPRGAIRPYPLVRSHERPLQQRFDPLRLRERIFHTLRAAASAGGVRPKGIASIAVAAQRGGMAFLDAEGKTIYAGPNTDIRAVFEGAEMDEQFGAKIYARTGHLPSMFFPPAKLRWWRAHHPRQAKRIARLLTLGAWAVHELCGETAEVAPTQSEAGLLDITCPTAGPSASLLQALGMDAALLPPMIPPGMAVGGLTTRGAKATGIPVGTPVHLAGPDAQTALLGMGASLGDTGIVAGWSAPVQRVTRAPVLDAQRRTWAGLHLPGDTWVVEANPGDTGAAVDTLRRLLGNRMTHARFDALAERVPETAAPVAAFWGPRALNLSRPGVTMGGLLVPVPVTQGILDGGTLARATLENVAFAIRECCDLLDQVLEAPGNAKGAIALGGGMAAGRVFPHMLTSVLGQPVRVHGPAVTATGAAIAGSRPVSEWAEAGREAAQRGRIEEPDPRAMLEYTQRFARWRRLRKRLDELAEEL